MRANWEPEIYAAVYATFRTILTIFLFLGAVASGYLIGYALQWLGIGG